MITTQSIVNFFLLQPVNIALCLIMMICAIYLQRNSFCIHVWGVTILLLVVLHKINLCYGKIENKFIIYEQIVITGGIIHAFVPIIGMFIPIAMYVHVGICFTVHILHLGQCYQVFNDIKMKDTNYMIILWAVNIMEFFVNLAYCLPTVISNKMFVVPLVVVELSALLLSSLRLKSIHQHHHTQQVDINQPNDQSNSITFLKQIQSISTSRITVCFLCASTAGLLISFKRYDFAVFETGYTILLLLNLLHLHNHTLTYHSNLTLWVGILTPLILIPLAWVSVESFSLLPSFIGGIIILVLSLPIMTLNLLKHHLIMSNHYSFFISLFGQIVYLITIILYIISSSPLSNHMAISTLSFHHLHLSFMVCSIAFSMAMILTDMKLVRGKRVHVNGLSDSSKLSSDGSTHLKSHNFTGTGTSHKLTTESGGHGSIASNV